MKLKILVISLASLFMISAANAQTELLINGDFSTTSYSTANSQNYVLGSEVGNGWTTKNHGAFPLTGNIATWNGASETLLQDSFAQLNSIGSASGSSLSLSFDWTPVAGSSFPDLNYQLVAWKADPGSLDISAVEMIRFINASSNSIGGTASGGTLTSFDLISGTNGSTGNKNMSTTTVSGTAGVTNNYSTSFDLSSNASGFQDISDFDYVGIRFYINGSTGTTAMGSTLDNVSLTVPSAVPEPSSAALLLGLASLGFMASRRRRS